jgi:hypothetical protein
VAQILCGLYDLRPVLQDSAGLAALLIAGIQRGQFVHRAHYERVGCESAAQVQR